MEIEYTEKIVSFIDVLGFSNLVYSKTNDPISEYFEYVLREFTEDLKVYKFEYYLISDSVVIHTEANRPNFEALVRTLTKLQMKLITRGIIVRGGISIGELYVNSKENIIVGPGLINAYNLESKAIYPRIIIDRKIIPLFFTNSTQMIKRNRGRISLIPPTPYFQDYPYIDFTYKLALVMQTPKLEVVKKLLSKNIYDNQNIDKYLWLKTHILCGFEKQKDYLDGKRFQNERDKTRLRIIKDFTNYVLNL